MVEVLTVIVDWLGSVTENLIVACCVGTTIDLQWLEIIDSRSFGYVKDTKWGTEVSATVEDWCGSVIWAVAVRELSAKNCVSGAVLLRLASATRKLEENLLRTSSNLEKTKTEQKSLILLV